MKDQHRVGVGLILLVIYVLQVVDLLDRSTRSLEAELAVLVYSAVMLLGLVLLVYKGEE